MASILFGKASSNIH